LFESLDQIYIQSRARVYPIDAHGAKQLIGEVRERVLRGAVG